MEELERIFIQISKVSISRHILSVIIIFLASMTNKYIITSIFKYINKFVEKTKNFADDSLVKALEKPLKLFIILKAAHISLHIIEYDKIDIAKVSLDRLGKMIIVIVVCTFLYNLTLENSLLYKNMGKNNASNTIAFPFLSIIVRLIIIIVGVSCIAKEFGFSGFITGLGISGVAFALMAQDTFSNLFGGVIIVLDRPFAIGDWIKTEEVEGVVEEITFRSTKIRTFSKAIATVPNSKMANNNIFNYSQREVMKVSFKFIIKPDIEIENIGKAINKIEEYLNLKDKIKKDLIIVSFNEFSLYGYGIFIFFYTTEMNYYKFEKLKQEINIDILKILRELNVELMFVNLNLENEMTELNNSESIEKS